MVRIFRDGAVAHQTRVVVGLPTNQTPVFSDQIDHMMVNPYWNVPASIVAAELLPQIRRDPAYFERNGFDIWLRWEGQTYSVTPYEVNWAMVQPTQVSFRQRPGPANALGQIKFMFPNSHDVYLHDTPSKSLFQRDARAFSHGCIRVLNPMEFADALLIEDPTLDAAGLEAMFGPNETRVDIAAPIPVHLAYFTAIIDAGGNLRFLNDVYGHSARVRAALGLT
jgi:murein L,D-transpeptidase YcbB/YkuD